MTPEEEAHFIQLWQAGTETTAMAQALGLTIPPAVLFQATEVLR